VELEIEYGPEKAHNNQKDRLRARWGLKGFVGNRNGGGAQGPTRTGKKTEGEPKGLWTVRSPSATVSQTYRLKKEKKEGNEGDLVGGTGFFSDWGERSFGG